PDTLAQIGGELGYLIAALRVNGPDPASAAPSHCSDAQRWAAAVTKAGGAAGEMLWQFPLPQHLVRADKRELLAAWDRLHAARAAELLTPAPLPTTRMYRLLDSTMAGAANQRNLMEGVALAPGGTSRRELAPVAEPSPDLVKASRARRHLQALAETPLGDKTESDKLLAQLGPVLAQLPDEQASAAAYAVASQFARAGQWTLAR